MGTEENGQSDRRIDLAARAGFLYYVAGYRQDDIAMHLGVSRQTAQRLVALAVDRKLVSVRLEHPIGRCMELAEALRQRYGLRGCEIVPRDPHDPSAAAGLAGAGANAMERELRAEDGRIITVGTGRALRASVAELTSMNCPQHRIVALLSQVAADGSASRYNIVERMAERVNAAHYPASLPVYARSAEDRAMLHGLDFVKSNFRLAGQSDATFVGIGSIGPEAAMLADGFLSAGEVRAIEAAGGVGEITGWVYGEACEANDRVTSVPLWPARKTPVYGIAAGPSKVAAIRGALRGRLINVLVTDEATAEALLR